MAAARSVRGYWSERPRCRQRRRRVRGDRAIGMIDCQAESKAAQCRVHVAGRRQLRRVRAGQQQTEQWESGSFFKFQCCDLLR